MIYERNHLSRNEIQGAIFDFHKSFRNSVDTGVNSVHVRMRRAVTIFFHSHLSIVFMRWCQIRHWMRDVYLPSLSSFTATGEVVRSNRRLFFSALLLFVFMDFKRTLENCNIEYQQVGVGNDHGFYSFDMFNLKMRKVTRTKQQTNEHGNFFEGLHLYSTMSAEKKTRLSFVWTYLNCIWFEIVIHAACISSFKCQKSLIIIVLMHGPANKCWNEAKEKNDF